MGDDAHHALTAVERVEGLDDLSQGLGVEGAEAFVQEEALERVAGAALGSETGEPLGQGEGQGQRGEEGLAPREVFTERWLSAFQWSTTANSWSSTTSE